MLEIENLSYRYSGSTALDRLSLRLETGKVLCVLGPSGCGKSTLLKLISGLEVPSEGHIRLGGRVIASAGRGMAPEHRGVNMVFQDYALWPHMNVRKIVGYGLNRLSRAARDERVDELLARLQITAYADRLPGQLSGGQQQRVAIARALATDPQLLLFDEPLSNLDVQLRQQMRHELAELLSRLGKTAIYVTHDPLEAFAFGDHLMVLKDGRVEQFGDASALFTSPASPWVAALAGYDNRLPAMARPAGNGHCRADIHGQAIQARWQASETAPGTGPVTVMIPASSVRLANGAACDEPMNELQGQVLHSINEGRTWRIRVAVGDARLTLNAPTALPRDQIAAFEFPVSETLAFP
ncbi:ABC transporter ATP-binding protein [Pseudomonas sp. Marseille-QA0892]